MQVENVHERLREARERHRVMRGNPFDEVRSGQIGELGVTVLGYDECQTVLTHPDTFSSSIYDQIMGPVMGRTLLELEGAEHRASRALVSPSFRSALLERWRDELVEIVVHELIDSFAPRGRAELADEFTFAFPVQVIARIMGLPRQDYPRFQRLSIELLNVVYDWERGIAASAALKTYFTEILAERRRHPQDDLISMLWQSEIHGKPTTLEDLENYCVVLFTAGLDTVVNGISHGVLHLARHPELQRELRQHPEKIQSASEEMLRRYTFTVPLRRVSRDLNFQGVEMKANDRVMLFLPAADLDSSEYPNAERFNIGRENSVHIAFGVGPHRCLGSHLARLELQIVYQELLARVPEFRLDPSRPVTYHGGHVIGPDAVWLTWDK